MSSGLLRFYLSGAPLYFGGVQAEIDEAVFLVAGVPFDATASYRPGTRFAPRAIREAAANIEFYSPRRRLDVENVKIHDLGDTVVFTSAEKQNKVLEEVAASLASLYPEKSPIFLGGEHTITYGIVKGYSRQHSTCLVVLDAHLDLRDEYMGDPFSHASVLRRIAEERIIKKALVIGARAYVAEEARYLEADERLTAVEALTIKRRGVEAATRIIRETLGEKCRRVHVSIDMDVFDPAYAPGVGNPEPEGLTPTEVLDILHYVVDEAHRHGGSLSLDVVEVNPLLDPGGVTSVLAAKLAVEFIAAVTANKQGQAPGRRLAD